MTIHPDVRAALDGGLPVVALETAVVTHGLPRPLNVDVALECEAAVRAAGAVPATIGVFRGELVVGFTEEALRALGNDSSAVKCSAADLGAVVAAGRTGGTTVSATIAVAARAGIAVMSSGGIGGVHRALAGEPYDISADLAQLARSPVVVITSGAKTVLDLPRTLEHLEALGVPVLGYQTAEFPAFYVRSSGLPLRHRFEAAGGIAAAVAAYAAVGYQGAVLVVQEPPEGISREEADRAIAESVERAAQHGIQGHAVTPFLLAELARLTGGATLKVNRSLLVANARLAAMIADALR